MLHLQHGGIEKQTITLANELSKKYEVEIISTYSMNKPPAYEISDRVKVRYLMDTHPNKNEIAEAIKTKNVLSLIKQGLKAVKILYLKRKKMQKAVKNLNCDFVLSTRVEYAQMLSKLAPKGVVTITQEHLHNDSKQYVNRCRRAFKNLDYLVVLCRGSKANFTEWLKDNKKINIIEIPNILENVPDVSAELKGNNLISVGRLHPVKNFSGLLDVFSLVIEQKPDAKLTIVGGGEEKGNLESKINQLNLQGNVTITGMVSKEKVEEYMLGSDVYVMTSFTECFPMVLLEASSVGLPLVSYDVPVGPEAIIENDKNGFLVQFEDKKRMADIIVEILNNKKLKKDLADSSKEMSVCYLPEKVMPLWSQIFDN